MGCKGPLDAKFQAHGSSQRGLSEYRYQNLQKRNFLGNGMFRFSTTKTKWKKHKERWRNGGMPRHRYFLAPKIFCCPMKTAPSEKNHSSALKSEWFFRIQVDANQYAEKRFHTQLEKSGEFSKHGRCQQMCGRCQNVGLSIRFLHFVFLRRCIETWNCQPVFCVSFLAKVHWTLKLSAGRIA